MRQKSSQNRRQVIAYVANPSRTRHQLFADVRKRIARTFPRSAQCDKYGTLIRQFRDLIARNKTDQNLREGRFKHVVLFCATQIIKKPSPSHRICREPVMNPSPTLRRRSQTHRKEVSAICTMRQICDINKTVSRLNCEK